MAFFLCRLHPPRPTFPSDMTADEAALMAAHAGFWRDEVSRGRALAFGPVLDPAGPWGLALVAVPDAAAAWDVVQADPVMAGRSAFRYDVVPMPSLVIGAPPSASPWTASDRDEPSEDSERHGD